MTAQYPAATPTLIDMYEPRNNILVEISALVDAAVTTIPMVDTSALPDSGYLTWTDGTNEIIFYTSKDATNLLGVTRGADGSTPAAHANASELEMRWNADYHVRQNEEIIAIGTDLRNAFSVAPDDSVAPADVAVGIEDRLDMYANRFRDIVSGGGGDWKDAPTRTLNAVEIDVLTRVLKAGDVMTGDLVFATNADGLEFRDSGGSDSVSLNAPASVTPYSLLLPTAQGGANSSLFNNGSGQLSFGLIVNSNIDGGASILLSKMESVTDGNLLIGNGSNVLAQVGQTGDVSISNTGVFAITALAIVDGDINGSAGIAFSKMSSLTASRLLASNGSGVVSELGWTHSSDNLTGPAGANIVLSGATSGAITIQAGDVTTPYTIKWPTTQGGASEFLQNDGAGNLTWVVPAGGGTVNSGVLGRLGIYPANGDTIDDQATIGSGTVDIAVASLAANRSYTIPDAGANASVVMTEGAATVNGTKTFSGFTLGANGAAGGFKFTGLAAGSVSGDSVRFEQVLLLAGGTMSGAIAMGTNKVTGLAEGDANGDAVRFEDKGKVLQVIEGVLDTSFSTSSTSYVTTGLTVTITPRSTSSRVEVIASGLFATGDMSTEVPFATLFRDSTDLGPGSGNGFSRVNINATGFIQLPTTMQKLDSPATTSAITYSVRLKRSGAVSTAQWNNSTVRTTITVREIEG